MTTTGGRPTLQRQSRVVLPVVILLIAVWLRTPGLWTDAPLDVDEALYASYGRQISHENNPLLIGLAVDKPPLHFYTLALSFKWFGQPSDWATRFPSFLASILTVAITWRLARSFSAGGTNAVLAPLLVAISPLDITHAGTGFVDPAVTLWFSLALLAFSHRHWGTGGLCAGLAFMTKQSALIYLPLIVFAGLVVAPPRRAQIWRFLVVFILIAIVPFLWQSWRAGGDPWGWWVLGAANNSPDRFARANEIALRFSLWFRFLGSASGSPLMLAVTLFGTFIWLRHPLRTGEWLRRDALTGLMLVFVSSYSLLYIVVAFNQYPRYTHALTVLLALLGAGVFNHSLTSTSRWLRRWAAAGALLAGLSILPNTLIARGSPPWLQPARDLHTGIMATAEHLNSLPPGTIVYDHWVGWLLDWYTVQIYPPDMWLRKVYYPTPEELVIDALSQPDPLPRYIVIPDWAPLEPWIAALNDAEFAPEAVLSAGQFTVYKLQPP